MDASRGSLIQLTGWQDAEKLRQLRSRIVQILNVPQGYAFRSSLAAALLDGLFEQPGGHHCMIQRCAAHKCIDHVHLYALLVLEFTDCHDRADGRVSFHFRAS